MTADYQRLAEANGIKPVTFWARISRGWSLEDAVCRKTKPYFYDWNPT